MMTFDRLRLGGFHPRQAGEAGGRLPPAGLLLALSLCAGCYERADSADSESGTGLAGSLTSSTGSTTSGSGGEAAASTTVATTGSTSGASSSEAGTSDSGETGACAGLEYCSSPGQVICAQGKLQICELRDGCQVWWSLLSCGSGQCNTAGTSCQACANTCDQWQATTCLAGTLRRCEYDELGCLQQGPAEACDSGFCQDFSSCGTCEHVCERDGQTACADGIIKGCTTDPNGCRYWSEPVTCGSGSCDDSLTCEGCSDACDSAGLRECFEGRARQCEVGTDGCLAWSDERVCEDGFCADEQTCGECPDACTPGTSVCANDHQVATCTEDERGCPELGDVETCAAHESCQNGRCTADDCVDTCPAEGATACQDGRELRCVFDEDADDCLEWETEGRACPAGQACMVGGCKATCDDACRRGETECVGDEIRTCAVAPSGCLEWGTPQSCGSGMQCQADACVSSCSHQCETLGASQCADGEMRTCQMASSGCREWGTAVACGPGQQCIADSCRPVSSTFAAAVTAGTEHTCALSSAGGMFCWGEDYGGALGNGINKQKSPEPLPVIGLDSGVTRFSIGYNTSCAVHRGTLKCWGVMSALELGHSETPEVVPQLPDDVVDVRVAWNSACAIGASGWLKCWGNNSHGQLGNGEHEDAEFTEPVDVLTEPAWNLSMLARQFGGTNAYCGVFSGRLRCWGNGHPGNLGNGVEPANGTNFQTSPQLVKDLPIGVESAAMGGRNGCAIVENSGYCWGDNRYANLGTGSVEPPGYATAHPMSLAGGAVPVQFAMGGHSMCALVKGGGVQCWGSNYLGQVGIDSDDALIYTPTVVPLGEKKAVAIALGDGHACAVLDIGQIYCWGLGSKGQLGTGEQSNERSPRLVRHFTGE